MKCDIKKKKIKISYMKTDGLTRAVNIVSYQIPLTHWGWVRHICISKLTTIGSDNGLLTGRRQAIIWINAGIMLIGPLGTNFSEILIHTFSFKKMHLKMLSGNGLAPNRRQATTWTNDDPVHWRIYAALGGDEFINIQCGAIKMWSIFTKMPTTESP